MEQGLKHLDALRSFVSNLVEQADKSGGCGCHRPPSLLLVGPPGAGKTYLVKQMSSVCDMPLFGVHTHTLSSEESLRALFGQARDIDYPCLFFLDDVECIISSQDEDPPCTKLQDEIRQELYEQIGPRKLKIYDSSSSFNPVKHPIDDDGSTAGSHRGFHSRNSDGEDNDDDSDDDDDTSGDPDNNGLILVAATSEPWMFYKDHELLSRFRGVYLVGLPDRAARYNLLSELLAKVQHNLKDDDIWEVVDQTAGFTPSDLLIVIKALNYKQFSFLFSLTGMAAQQRAETSSEASSSEITESDTETDDGDSDGSSEESKCSSPNDENMFKTNEKSPIPVVGSKNSSIDDGDLETSDKGHSSKSSPASSDSGAVKRSVTVAVPLTLDMLENDWTTDDDDDEEDDDNKSTLKKLDGTVKENKTESLTTLQNLNDAPSPDSALGISKTSEDEEFPCSENCSEDSGKINNLTKAETSRDLSNLSDEREVNNCNVGYRNENMKGDNSSPNSIENNLYGDSGVGLNSPRSVRKSLSRKGSKCKNVENAHLNNMVNGDDSYPEMCNDKNGRVEFSSQGVDEVDASYHSPGQSGVVFSKKIVNSRSKSLNNSFEDGKIGEFLLHYSEPPDPLKNDNEGLHSDDSDDDNHRRTPRTRISFAGASNDDDRDNYPPNISLSPSNSSNHSGRRSRSRISFGGLSSAMDPLSINVNDDEGENDNYPPNISLSPGNNSLVGCIRERGNNILRGLLANSPSNSDDVLNNLGRSNSLREKNRRSPDGSAEPLVVSGLGMLAALGILNDDSSNNDSGMKRSNRRGSLDGISHDRDDHHTLKSFLDCVDGVLNDDNKTSSPGSRDSLNVSPILTPTHSVTPTPSISSNRSISASSGSGSGRRVTGARIKSKKHSNDDSSSDNENRSTPLSENSSATTCNQTGETLECISNAEERLRDVADDIPQERMAGDGKERSDNINSAEDSEDDDTHRTFNLDDLGEVSIKIITVNDVLEAVHKTPRTVSDDEIKRYTEFMAWFSKVAKSACPHKGVSEHDGASEASSMCGSQMRMKKRKGPLKKLGKFLLKALMFILD